jgi:hypothetical protein
MFRIARNFQDLLYPVRVAGRMVLVVCLTGFRCPGAGAMATTMEPGGGQDRDNPPSHPVLTPDEPRP